jgi:hypothetical protein
MNKDKALSLAKELMPNFSTIIISEDFDSDVEDSWLISVADSSFYDDKLRTVNAFAKKNNLCYVIQSNTLKFFADDSVLENTSHEEAKPE